MSTRKMQNHIVKGKNIFVGLEDSKKTWKITVRCDKREIHYTSMQARYTNLLNYFRNKFPDCDITVIYEAGFKGFGLHDQLVSDDIACVVTPPNKVTQEKHTRVKTDKIDSRRLATVLENGDYKKCRVPDSERRSDRTISRSLTQLQKEITRIKNRIRKFFDANGYAEIFPAGAWSEKDYRTARELELPPSLMIAVESYWEILDKYVEVKKRLLKQMNILAKKERYAKAVSILRSIPGVGRLTAIRLVLEWGEDIGESIKSGKSLACFAGLTQSEYSTGDTVRRGRITGQGRGCIRAWLIQCSWICIKKDPVMLEAFNRITSNTGSKKKAIVAIARKLVVRMWTCMHNKEEYLVGVIE